MWVIHRSQLLKLPWGTCVCPSKDQALRQYSCLYHGDLGRTMYTGELVAQVVQEIWYYQIFFCSLWQFCPSEDRPGRWCSCLIHGVPGGIKCIGTGDMALLESFSSFGSWYSKGLPGLSFYIAWHSRQSKVPPDWSPLLFVSMSGTQRDTLSRVFIGQLLALVCGKRQATVMAPLLHETQQYCPGSLTARLFSKGTSHHNVLLYVPLGHLSTINNSPHPGISLQSLHSSSQPQHILGNCVPICGKQGWSMNCLTISHSIQIDTNHLLHCPTD